jgi:hypothetical protein
MSNPQSTNSLTGTVIRVGLFFVYVLEWATRSALRTSVTVMHFVGHCDGTQYMYENARGDE